MHFLVQISLLLASGNNILSNSRQTKIINLKNQIEHQHLNQTFDLPI
jgi:hypothetical protein